MSSPSSPYDLPAESAAMCLRESHVEYGFIGTLQGLKYEYRDDITDHATLEQNFHAKFQG